MKEYILLKEITLLDIEDTIRKVVREEFGNILNPQPDTVLLTRKEVAGILGITLVTLNAWSKMGKIPSYRLGTRVRYKKHEVMDALNKVTTLKYGRA